MQKIYAARVPYELALKLKRRNYTGNSENMAEYIGIYEPERYPQLSGKGYKNGDIILSTELGLSGYSYIDGTNVDAPLVADVLDWLAGKGIFISVIPERNLGEDYCFAKITKTRFDKTNEHESGKSFNTPLDAILWGIEAALDLE